MQQTLKRLVNRQQTAEMIYIDELNRVTKRRVRVLKVKRQLVVAYCFTRRSIRTFKIDNILALTPMIDDYLIAH